jgi:hypothetical protein
LEVNTNPGLEESSPLIKTLLPRMIDDMLRLTIDNAYCTIYSDQNSMQYTSPFPVDSYSDNENLWDFVTDFND